MALNRPSLSTLITRSMSDIQSRLPGSNPLLRHSFLGAIAKTLAGALHGLYGLAETLSRQIIPATATGDYLERWSTVWGVSRGPATHALGHVTFTGDTGTTIPSGLQLQSDDATEYVTTGTGTIGASGEVVVASSASEAGDNGNISAGTTLMLISPSSGIDSTATVSADGISGGADIQSDADLRSDLLQRIQHPPHGGNQADYVTWAQSVAGVSAVWVTPLYQGDGSVQIWIGETGYSGPNLASDGLVQTVQDYIDSVRPVGFVNCVVAAPTVNAQPIAMTLVPDSSATRAAVTAELRQLFDREAEPEGQILISHIREAVSIAAGETDHTISAPTADIQAGTGEILTLGAITWS